jgi:hypothetical protein
MMNGTACVELCSFLTRRLKRYLHILSFLHLPFSFSWTTPGFLSLIFRGKE